MEGLDEKVKKVSQKAKLEMENMRKISDKKAPNPIDRNL